MEEEDDLSDEEMDFDDDEELNAAFEEGDDDGDMEGLSEEDLEEDDDVGFDEEEAAFSGDGKLSRRINLKVLRFTFKFPFLRSSSQW